MDEFGSKSMMGDVLRMAGGDKTKAAAMVAAMQQASREDLERKMGELRDMFAGVPDATLLEVLQKHDGNVEAAIPDVLIAFNDNQRRRRKARSSNRRRQATQADAAAQEGLLRMFATISASQVQQVIDEKEGDIEAATEALLALAERAGPEEQRRASEAQQLQAQERRLRELQLEALTERFDYLEEAEVRAELDRAKWDLTVAAERCLDMDRQRKVDRLHAAFKKCSKTEIAHVLAAHNWNETDAATALGRQSDNSAASADSGKKPTPTASAEKSAAPAAATTTTVSEKDRDEIRRAAAADMHKSKLRLDDETRENRQNFHARLAHIVEVQAHHGHAPGTAAPLPRQIDDLLGLGLGGKDAPTRPTTGSSEVAASTASVSTAGDAAVRVVARPGLVDCGNTISVEWEVSSGDTSSWDWVALYKADEQNSRNYITYEWRGDNIKSGVVTFKAPQEYGDYVFKYMANNHYEPVAVSNRVSVGPEIDLRCTVTENDAGKKVKVNWVQESGNAVSRAWLGLFERSEVDNSKYLTYDWADKAKGATSAGVTFTLPVKPGDYEVRFFPGNIHKYADSTRSTPFRVEGEDKLTLGGISQQKIDATVHIVSVDPSADKAWVGIYLASEKSLRRPRRYKWVGASRDANIAFESVPIHGGTYVVRLMSNNYQVLAESATFELAGTV